MNPQYDENLQDNPFFRKLCNDYRDLIKNASEKGWIICVPRNGTIEENTLEKTDFLDHILVSDTKGFNSHYISLSQKHLNVKNKIITSDCGDIKIGCVQILFQETFYAENLKYVVWCIDYPFTYNCELNENISYVPLATLNACIEFLQTESSSKEILEQINNLVRNFLLQHINFETEVLQVQKDLIGGLYSQCLQVTLKHSDIRNKINSSAVFLENIKLAVETLMQHYLNNKLFNAICTYLCHDDARFNKIICNNHVENLKFKNGQYFDLISAAKFELSKLNQFTTILGKINCLKRTFNALSSHSNSSESCITSDKLLQYFVMLILELNINNWIANLIFIKEFRFSSLDISDENSFLIASLEAAVQYVKDNNFITKSDDNSSHEFLLQVENGNLEFVRKYFEDKTTHSVNSDNEQNLCHPLCFCEKCEKIQKIEKGSPIDIVNENGQNALHISAIKGHLKLVEFFINRGADINSLDNNNNTALHFAAFHGHQDVLLYLLHQNATINSINNEDNTALHLAANNGHERSVKALIYSPNVNFNACNSSRNTPLHLAAKWGYIEIVQILLEAGCSTKIENDKNQKPQDVSQNYYIYKLILEATNNMNEKRIVQTPPKKITFLDYIHDFKTPPIVKNKADYGIQPKSPESIKKIELLLRAIELNDLPLTYFYLGLPQPLHPVEFEIVCHPLCDCEKCSNNKIAETKISKTNSSHVNVNACNSEGYTPLHVAAKFGRKEILRLLLDSCAFINVKTYKTLYTPLHLACMNMEVNIVRELLKSGNCDFDAQDYKGNTPLHYACIKNDVKIVELLLSHDADRDLQNCKGYKPYHEAQDRMFFNIVKLFEQSSSFIAEEND